MEILKLIFSKCQQNRTHQCPPESRLMPTVQKLFNLQKMSRLCSYLIQMKDILSSSIPRDSPAANDLNLLILAFKLKNLLVKNNRITISMSVIFTRAEHVLF